MSAKRDRIRDDGRENKYFHQMLNMADDELNPYQYRLLGHYKRVCGETGACWEGVRTTAEKCKMSVGKVSQTRRELEELGYIRTAVGKNESITVTLIDRWVENVNRYAECSYSEHECSSHEQGVHTVNASVHVVKQRITIEEEPLKNNPIHAPIGAGTSPDWISEFFQALAAFAQAELERDPAFEAICRELFGIEHTDIQDKSTRGRINGLASTARNNFQTVYEQHFTDGWTRDLEEKLARAISAFVKSWKATHADTAVPLARDKFGTAFLKFLQTYKPDRKPAPAAPPALIQPLTPEERTALAEARKTIRPAWEQTGESTS